MSTRYKNNYKNKEGGEKERKIEKTGIRGGWGRGGEEGGRRIRREDKDRAEKEEK